MTTTSENFFLSLPSSSHAIIDYQCRVTLYRVVFKRINQQTGFCRADTSDTTSDKKRRRKITSPRYISQSEMYLRSSHPCFKRFCIPEEWIVGFTPISYFDPIRRIYLRCTPSLRQHQCEVHQVVSSRMISLSTLGHICVQQARARSILTPAMTQGVKSISISYCTVI